MVSHYCFGSRQQNSWGKRKDA